MKVQWIEDVAPSPESGIAIIVYIELLLITTSTLGLYILREMNWKHWLLLGFAIAAGLTTLTVTIGECNTLS